MVKITADAKTLMEELQQAITFNTKKALSPKPAGSATSRQRVLDATIQTTYFRKWAPSQINPCLKSLQVESVLRGMDSAARH